MTEKSDEEHVEEPGQSLQETSEGLKNEGLDEERKERLKSFGTIIDSKLGTALIKARVRESAEADVIALLRPQIEDAQIIDEDLFVTTAKLKNVPMSDIVQAFLHDGRQFYVDPKLQSQSTPAPGEAAAENTMLLNTGEVVRTSPPRLRELHELPADTLFDNAGPMPPPGRVYDPSGATEEPTRLTAEQKASMTPLDLMDLQPKPPKWKPRTEPKPIEPGEGMTKRTDDLYERAGEVPARHQEK